MLTSNLLTFQLVTGDERFYCIGVYIPPTDMMGVEDLRAAWEACPEGCMPLILGDLNINFVEPQDERDKVIHDLNDDIDLEKIRTSVATQTINPSTVDLAAEEGKEAALLAARLCHGAQTGLQAISERRVPMATISRLRPPSHRGDHKIREEETQGVSEEVSGIPTAITPRGAAG